MAQAMVNFRMDEKLKERMEKTCKEMGLTVTAAYTMFATKVTKERRIPFEVSADPSYSAENEGYARKGDLKKQRIEDYMTERTLAFERLDNLDLHVPENFDYKKELSQVREERYGYLD